MEGTLRTHNEQVRERARTLVKEIVGAVAAAHGATAEVRWMSKSNPPTVNDRALVEAVLPAMRHAIGEPNLVEARPVMGAEDFAYFQRQIPGAMFWLGVGNESKGITGSLHTVEYDADESSLATGMKAMANAILALLDGSAR